MSTLEQISQRPVQGTSQATVVEQSRAVAEVAAQVRTALEFPRDEEAARLRMQRACGTLALAERAFYSVPNRGQGPSVHLARELGRCWGNLQAGMVELRRDDSAGESEMQAFAWDVEHGTRFVRSFINPHKRGQKKLNDPTDIVNSNNGAGARALRETIFNVLPVWFVEEAKALCEETLKRGNGEPLAERVRKAALAFERHKVTPEMLETRLGRKRGRWDEQDVATLLVLFQSLNAGETTVAEEFPAVDQPVTAADLAGKSAEPGEGGA